MATAAPSATPAGAAADRPLLGVLLVVVFCVLAPLGDAMGKLLGALPLAQILFARYGIQAVLLVPLVRASGLSPALSPRGARGSGR